MKDDVRCPYCKVQQEINHDDSYGYEQDELHQQECTECEKTFTFYTSIHFSYDAYTADCLNGGEHRYKETKTLPEEFAVMKCRDCEAELPLTEERIAKRQSYLDSLNKAE